MQELTSAEIPRQLIEPLIDDMVDDHVGAWLTFVRALVSSSAGMVVRVREDNSDVVALEPQDAPDAARLFEAATSVLSDSQPVIAGDSDAPVAAWPVKADGKVIAIAIFALNRATPEQLDDQLMRIEWAAGWLELLVLRETTHDARADLQQHSVVLEGFDVVLDAPSFGAASLSVCNYLARSFQCDRVVLGFTQGHDIKIECQSDSSHYVEKVNTIRLTRLAMQEAADQLETVDWPDDEGTVLVRRAHAELSADLNNVAVLSIPLVRHNAVYAVVLLEREPAQHFDAAERLRAEALCNLVGRVLLDKRNAELPLHRLMLQAARRGVETFLRPGHLRRKVAVLLAVAMVVLFSLWRAQYRPAGEALVEGAQLRAVLAPFDGFLDDAMVRPGDEVASGELLATLDARELELERLKWLSEKAQAQRQSEDALAANDRADVQIYRAQIDRSLAELALLEYQLQRTELRSPFDAVVVEGDLSQRIGSAVRLGETLFELAPEGKYRIVIFIDEFTIGDIELGQTGEVILSALASRALPLTVNRIMPMAEVRDGETVYRVEGEVQLNDAALRPGLVGVAKINVDERLVIVNWTRTLMRWLRMQTWRLWG